jgi:hypothetical protein
LASDWFDSDQGHATSSSSSSSDDDNFDDDDSESEATSKLPKVLQTIVHKFKSHRSRRLHHKLQTTAQTVNSFSVYIKSSLRRKIWRGEYVDFTKLIPRNTRQLLHKSAKRQPVATINHFPSWQAAFLTFSDILLQKRPELSSKLLAYHFNILQLYRQELGLVWLQYDIEFRINLPYNTSLDWAVIDQATVSQARFEARETQKVQSFRSSFSTGARNPNTPRICYSYNGSGCSRKPCRFSHVCTLCAGGHPKTSCPKAQVSAAKSVNNQPFRAPNPRSTIPSNTH